MICFLTGRGLVPVHGPWGLGTPGTGNKANTLRWKPASHLQGIVQKPEAGVESVGQRVVGGEVVRGKGKIIVLDKVALKRP